MGRKILVTKEWHGRAMQAMSKLHELESMCDALQKFPYLHLNQEQHEKYQKLLDEYTDRMIDDGKV